MGGAARLIRPEGLIFKELVLDGSAGNGAVGTIAIATVTGQIVLTEASIWCVESLIGASATIQAGVVGNAGALIPSTTANLITAGSFWNSTTPEVGASLTQGRSLIGANIILTVGTANITAGRLKVGLRFDKLSPDGNLHT